MVMGKEVGDLLIRAAWFWDSLLHNNSMDQNPDSVLRHG